jgi:hypothetical protein
MYEFIKTEKGWLICWGGAVLFRDVNKAPVVRPAPTVSEQREPVKVLSA